MFTRWDSGIRGLDDIGTVGFGDLGIGGNLGLGIMRLRVWGIRQFKD